MNEASLLKILKASKMTILCATGVDALASIYIKVNLTVDQQKVNQKLNARIAELEGAKTPS